MTFKVDFSKINFYYIEDLSSLFSSDPSRATKDALNRV